MRQKIMKSICVMLAVIMLVGIVPAQAMDISDANTFDNSSAGSGWEIVDSNGNSIGSNGEFVVDGSDPPPTNNDEDSTVPPMSEDDDGNLGELPSVDDNLSVPPPEEPLPPEDGEFVTPAPMSTEDVMEIIDELTPEEAMVMLIDIGEQSNTDFEWVEAMLNAYFAMVEQETISPTTADAFDDAPNFSAFGFEPFSTPVQGSVSFNQVTGPGVPPGHPNVEINFYHPMSWAQQPPGDGWNPTPFCAQFGVPPVAGTMFTWTPQSSGGNNDRILRAIVGSGTYLQKQAYIWGVLNGWNSFIAYSGLNTSGVDITGWTLYRASVGGGQDKFAARYDDDSSIPDPGPGGGSGDGEFGLNIEWWYTHTTVMERGQDTEFRNTQPHGYFHIDKTDLHARPLAGATFEVRIQFASGGFASTFDYRRRNASNTGYETITVTTGAGGWGTVSMGPHSASVTVSYLHPMTSPGGTPPNNFPSYDTGPATITVRETVPPPDHTLDNTNNPQTFQVWPSYNLITRRTEWLRMFTVMSRWYRIWSDDGQIDETFGPESEEITEDQTEFTHFQEYVSDRVGDTDVRAAFRNERISGEIIVRKRCAVTGQLLEGATFRLEGINIHEPVHVDRHGTTVRQPDGDISFRFTGLHPGTYRITEIHAPNTHNLDSYPQMVTVESGQTIEVVFENTRRQGLQILKVDSEGNPLAGALFEITRGSGALWGTFSTDANGLIIIPNNELTTGLYHVREVRAPAGFLIDEENNPQSIWIDNADGIETYHLVFRNPRRPQVEIIKIDSRGGERLPGAVFRLTDPSTGNSWEQLTDQNGVVLFSSNAPDRHGITVTLEVGRTYILEEISAPPGYINSGWRHELTLSPDNTHTFIVENDPEPSLEIVKRDRLTGALLEGATFRVAYRGSIDFQEVTTGANGVAAIRGMAPGTYVVTEVRAPNGYILTEEEHTVILRPGEVTVIEIFNDREPSMEIVKFNLHDGRRLAGATFRISWNNGTYFRDVTTNENGTALILGLQPGWYTVTEIRAPDGHILSDEPVQVYLEPGERRILTIANRSYPSLTIEKTCSVTGNPLQFARFRVERIRGDSIALIGEFTTDENGRIHLHNVEPGRFRETEVSPPAGYVMDRGPWDITIAPGQAYVLQITNTPMAPIMIRKVDPQGNPLAGAEFTITTMTGQWVATVQTVHTGWAIVPNVAPGRYIVREVRAPDGYVLNDEPQYVEMVAGEPVTLTFVNYPAPQLQIVKVDADTGRPLVGAAFRITESNGRFVAERVTGPDGMITLSLPPGEYVVAEIRAPDGYVLDMTPEVVVLEAGRTTTITFRNLSRPGLQLVKVCAETGVPVEGSRFEVFELRDGWNRSIGIFTTGANGTFFIPNLAPGYYEIVEVHAPNGYILDPTPRRIFVEAGKINVVEFENVPYANLRLLKICAETRQPLEGAVFRLFDADRLEIATVTTNALGEIWWPNMEAGTYYLQEQRAPAGYLHDNTVRRIELSPGQTTTVEWPNVPLGSLRIIKIDGDTRQPLYGVVFDLMDRSNNVLGRFRTDRQGTIAFSRNLAPGRYHLREVQAAPGYFLDNRIHVADVEDGMTVEIVVENDQLGTLRLRKVCAETGQPLRGAAFLLYNRQQGLMGEFVTNDAGEIVIENRFTTGRYFIREIRSPQGYVLDDQMRPIDMRVGHTTEVVISNTRVSGEIELVKVSSADSNARLSGAVFQVFNERLEVVGEMTTGSDGVARLGNLPLGRYAIKEVTSPNGFILSEEVIYVDIRVQGDTVRVTVQNDPSDLDVTVNKNGIRETMPGEVFVYHFPNIANNSNVALEEFFWRDILPTEALRIQSLNTGTWNQRVVYELWVRTNHRDYFRVRNNLHSNIEYTIDLRPETLRLASNEFVTETKVVFGTVQPGFTSALDPFITVQVLDGLPLGTMFTNRTDGGGRYGDEWVFDRDSWVTGIFRPNRRIPQTGGPGSTMPAAESQTQAF